MKHVCLILALIVTSSFWGFDKIDSGIVDSIFQESNELYLANEFEDAISGYLSILDQGISNQVLYYNIGNAYYRLDKLGYARLYYEKAKSFIGLDNGLLEDIHYNISFLETQLVDEITPLPQFFIIKMINNLTLFFSNNGWAFILIIVLYVNLVLLLLFLFSSSSKLKSISVKSLLFAFPFLLVVFSFFYMNSYQAEDVFAILVSQNTYVKTAPSLNAANQFIIHEGLKFEIIDMVDGWSRVLLSDGKDGWVENNHFLKIN